MALVLGGFFIGGSLVSADTPTPTAAEEGATPRATPSSGDEGDGNGERHNGECEKDAEGGSGGARFGGARGGLASARF